MKLTKRQRDLLRWLPDDDWTTPSDVGGWDGSYHSTVLRQLVKKGLTARRRRPTFMGSICIRRGSYEYRRLPAGREALAEAQP